MKKKIGIKDRPNKVKKWREFLKESIFVSKDDVDKLLDKISTSGINSLSDVERNRLTLFSDKDKEIIKIIEEMGDITNDFRELNKRMNKLSKDGKNKEAHDLMVYWMELNDKLRPLEQSFRKWGIELGDQRLDNLMRKVRPDAYNRNVIDNIENKFNEGKLDDIDPYDEEKWDDDNIILKSEKENKESCLRTILNRGNLMLNTYDKIEWDDNILKIGISYFEYGKGTKILSFLKHKSLYFNYWIDFKNKMLYDKNLLGGTYILTDEELDKIYNKYYWFKE